MTISRTETDAITGESINIPQAIYIGPGGDVLVIDEGVSPPSGYTRGDEMPPVTPPTREQVEALRLAAYADPVTGSDRYFAEAARMNAMGEAGADAVIAAGVARYEKIQAEYPWP